VSVRSAPLHVSGSRFERNAGRCIQTDHYPPPYPVTIENCQFIRNRGSGFGVAMNLQYAANYVVEGCLFLENVAEVHPWGGSVRVAAGSGEIRHNVFAYDSCYAASSLGAGVVLEGGSTVVRNNTFVGCHATLNGVAFLAASGAVGTFTGNVVAYSTGGPAVRFVTGTSIVGGCNLLWANALGDFAGGVGRDPTDVTADPLFCDLENLDFTVRDDSPCVIPPTPSCAPIGALGVGCGIVGLEPSSFGRIKALFR